jgi:hypothetical protein
MKIEKGNVDGAAERSGGITFQLFYSKSVPRFEDDNVILASIDQCSNDSIRKAPPRRMCANLFFLQGQ